MARRLAAILATDVVGYSRLMAADEAGTHARLKALRQDFIDPKIAEHHGRIAKLMGDGALVEFASVVDAVECAAAIQNGVAERQAELPEDRAHRVSHRHQHRRRDHRRRRHLRRRGQRRRTPRSPGRARRDLRLAHRLQPRQGQGRFGFEPMGEHRVKNIPEPVTVYRVIDRPRPARESARAEARRHTAMAPCGAYRAAAVALLVAASGFALWQSTRGPEPSAVADDVLALPSGPSIAVLPFDNLSVDPEQEHFVDGITEEIITALTQFRELFVIARNSSFQYKGQPVDVRKVGEDLGVQYVLEGSVRKAANTIRVTAQLTNAASGAHEWAESYDRELTAENIFDVQDEITEHIVTRIAEPYGVITRAGLQKAKRKSTHSLSAYECVLRAREYYAVEVPELFPPARDCLERAIILDPDYAEAWIWLALLYIRQHSFGLDGPAAPPPLDRALDAAQRATKLEPDNAMAHFALAGVYFFRHELERFRVVANTALTLNPNNALALAELGNYFGYLGELDLSLALTKKAMLLKSASSELVLFNDIQLLLPQARVRRGACRCTKLE